MYVTPSRPPLQKSRFVFIQAVMRCAAGAVSYSFVHPANSCAQERCRYRLHPGKHDLSVWNLNTYHKRGDSPSSKDLPGTIIDHQEKIDMISSALSDAWKVAHLEDNMIYLYIYIYIYIYMYLYIHLKIYLSIYLSISIYRYISIYTYIEI